MEHHVAPVAGYQQFLNGQLPTDGAFEARVAAVNEAGQGPWCTTNLYMSP